MKRVLLLGLILPVIIGLTSCQLENGNEKNLPIEEKTALEQPVFEIQECLVNNNYQSIDTELPLFGILDRDVKLIVNGNPLDIPLAGIYEGRKAVHEYFAKSHAKIRILDVSVQEILREGNQVNAHLRIKGLVKATKNTYDLEYVYAMTMEKYRIKSIAVYYDTFNFRRAMLEKGPITVMDIRNPTTPVWNPQDTTDYKPLIAAGLGAFYSGDIPTFLSLVHPEIQWVFKGDTERVPFAGLYSGYPGMLDFIPRIAYNLQMQGLTITGIVQQGNRVDYFITESGLAYATGKTFTANIIQSFLIKDGQVIEFKSYNDTFAVSQAFTLN